MIHLHNHSHYSILDGLSKVPDIVTRAKAIGASAVAITDHANINSLPELFSEAKAQGIKPIIGCEFYLVDNVDLEFAKIQERYHLTVWAKSWAGVQSIMEQLTLANRQFYYRPRLSFDQALNFKDCVIGLACSGGVFSRDDYYQKVGTLYEIYEDDLYAEIMPHVVMKDGKDIQEIVNRRALEFYEHYDLRTIVTNDAHYINAEDYDTHNLFKCIGYRKTLEEAENDSWGRGFYMRSEQEMREAFKRLGYLSDEIIEKSLANVQEVADKCNVEIPAFQVNLPSIHKDEEKVFRQSCLDGWSAKIKGKVKNLKEYGDRLVYEIGIIKRMGFVRYFLIVQDIINWARSHDIMVGPARGSAAGSLVCYLMGITQVDPLKHGLYFERFLNPDRVGLPDIDVDFQDDRRQEVFDYIVNTYGADKVGQITTFGYMSIKSAFRDVARVYGIKPLTINVLSKQIESEDSFDKMPDLVRFRERHPKIVEEAIKLVGTIRQVGVHACGMVVSSDPLNKVCVLEKRNDSFVTCWDKDCVEKFGLLKIDVLGLSTLGILNYAKKLIKKHRGVDINFEDIPLDDPKTLEIFKTGDGVGVFQMEHSGMQGLLRDLQAGDFETVTATTALFRPGSLQSGQTQKYVQVAKGTEYENYVCPQLKPILSPTNGVMVYQEQIMRIFVELGGFSWAGADTMRKIIGKKLGKDEFAKHKTPFLEGCKARGIDERVANTLFNQMAEFASYSFNKSHAVAYTMLSFWCAYLKANYPLEFYSACLSSASDDKATELARDAEKRGIRIMKPDINLSEDKYILYDGGILAPLGVIKGVGSTAVQAILEARGTGVFLSVDDMMGRVNKRVVNKRVVEALERAGAFECLGVIERDIDKRNKNYAELLPIHSSVPTLSFRSEGFNLIEWEKLSMEMAQHAKDHGREYMEPVFKSELASIMVINNYTPGESEHLTSKGTKYLLNQLSKRDIKRKHIYYTSPLKCRYDNPRKADKACASVWPEFLKREIAIVKPKVIVCCCSDAIPIFVPDGKMGKLVGKVLYNKDYDAYVLFTYSPQYAYFQPDKALEIFQSSMDVLQSMFIDL